MDGMATRGNVVVIGATDRIDLIDPALRRPGRFETEIEIGMPDKQTRHEILQKCVSGMPLSQDTNLEKLAEMTDSYTGADLIALCREAAMKALRRYLPEINLEEELIPQDKLEKIEIRMEDFLVAYEKILPTTRRH
jgi:transitional endoplasmic reticulum ATPase